ncbi:helix-turn-helix domain-containing protein [Bizionia paragorgiae]|uniref:helix-turn-helix domain-containing protein n=1 Tax=Bizionia paragorgiae TaxID=283786 RepID=UPI003A91EF35
MANLILSPLELDAETINRIAIKTAELIQLGRTPEPKPANDLITPKEACKLLQCTTVTLWRWEKKGRVTAYGLGGKKFFKRSELLESIVKK